METIDNREHDTFNAIKAFGKAIENAVNTGHGDSTKTNGGNEMNKRVPQWVDFEYEDCPSCGSTLQVLNTCEEEGFYTEGDEVRCTNENGDCEAKNLFITCIENDDFTLYASITGEW